MPIYEYKCQSCHRTLEFIQKFSDPLQTECPHCHGNLEKIVSSPHFELKGTGWYVTDFKNSDKKSAESTKSSEETKTIPEANKDSADKISEKTPETHSNSTNDE